MLILSDWKDKNAKVQLSDEGIRLKYHFEEIVLKSKKHIELFGIKFSLYYYIGKNDQGKHIQI